MRCFQLKQLKKESYKVKKRKLIFGWFLKGYLLFKLYWQLFESNKYKLNTLQSQSKKTEIRNIYSDKLLTTQFHRSSREITQQRRYGYFSWYYVLRLKSLTNFLYGRLKLSINCSIYLHSMCVCVCVCARVLWLN